MDTILYPYLIAVVATVAVLLAGWFAFVRYQRMATDHQVKAQRIPDFVRWVQLGEQIADMEQRREELRDELARAESLVLQAAEARELLDQNAENLRRAAETRTELQRAESDLVSLREQVALDKEELRKAQEALAKATFEREEQDRQAARLLKELGELEQDRSQLRDAIAGLQSDTARRRDEHSELTSQVAGLRAEVAGLEARKAQLEPELAALRQEHATTKSQLLAIQGEAERMEGIKARLAGELGPAGSANDEEKLGDLQQALFEPTFLAQPSALTDEKEALARVADHLRVQRLRFSTRVLRAFHTALKVQDESPLLVLAGISGTGKSLLPQKYAEAMGIHCHVVAVQPRWDGPQDLLGFYHHLEQRFKSTQLSRALVQFDRFGKLHEDDHNLSDRMLLVVLDEMNLARVEYYFSEFLSKLETRRDLDIDDAQQRARAAIPLDLGMGSGSQGPLSLFVDRNVLFVGTINEDESTQTLSDKVVDRSNVIRFARPAKLTQTQHADGGTAAPSKQHLPWATWRSWLQDASPLQASDQRLIEETASQLNNALGGIGKAFGYRTFRAMRAYAQHYPLRSEQGLRDALADQVEQRVLPRLRGIDAQEQANSDAIDQVLSIVKYALKDTGLADAIALGRQGHSFLWQGVERSD